MNNKRRTLLAVLMMSYFFFFDIRTMTTEETKEPQTQENPHEVPLDEAHKQRLLSLYRAARSSDGSLLAKLLASAHEHYTIESIYVMTVLCWGIHGPKTSSSNPVQDANTEKFLKAAIDKFKKAIDAKHAIPVRAIDQHE